jgi:hypothetical protein
MTRNLEDASQSWHKMHRLNEGLSSPQEGACGSGCDVAFRRRLILVEVEFDLGAVRVVEEVLPDAAAGKAAQLVFDAFTLQGFDRARQVLGAERHVVEHPGAFLRKRIAMDDVQDRRHPSGLLVSPILQSSIEPIVADGCTYSKSAAKPPVLVESLTILDPYPRLLLVRTRQMSPIFSSPSPPRKEAVRKSTGARISVPRPSRRPPCPEEPPPAASRRGGLLRMRSFLNAIKGLPHAEERPTGRVSKHAPPCCNPSLFGASVNFLTASLAGMTKER